jgi:ATP-dependent Zn protease
MRQAFEQAKRSAPSLLILEEIDAVAPARGPMSQDHKVEELTEILRMIESAAKNGVLVLATTNRKEALDPAVLRTGRFDHSVLVDYPTSKTRSAGERRGVAISSARCAIGAGSNEEGGRASSAFACKTTSCPSPPSSPHR